MHQNGGRQTFNSIIPRSRHERDAQKNKEIIEKRMIDVRGREMLGLS